MSVQDDDPADIFSDEAALRASQEALARGEPGPTAPKRKARRGRLTVLYSPLTAEISCRLWGIKAPGSAWACWAELDRLVFERHQNPLHFIVPSERAACVPGNPVRARAIEALARAGLVEILERGKGVPFLVRCLWLPDKST
jgi:hypothetical protein